MARVAIIQSNYIPWKGYFDIIRSADVFVLYDSVQYTRRDWRNRNRIKGPNGLQWLTIPVESKGKYTQAIEDVRVSDSSWAHNHLRTIEANYRRAAHFGSQWPFVSSLYQEVEDEPLLTVINEWMLRKICAHLGITTPIRRCREVMDMTEARSLDSSERLLALCQALGATSYLSGPSADGYLDVPRFETAGIKLEWMSYEGYPDYPQIRGEFQHGVSILDLLLNTGADAPHYLERSR